MEASALQGSDTIVRGAFGDPFGIFGTMAVVGEVFGDKLCASMS
jgi:hypothetical protein